MVLTLHHLNQSQSQRILWLLEELQVPYELKLYHRDSRTKRAPEELKKVHPLGKSPVIEDDGIVLAESGAIIDYLIAEYGAGKFVAQDKKGRVMDQYWNHFANATHQTWLMTLITLRMAPMFIPPDQREQASGALPIIKGISSSFVEPEVTKANAHVSQQLKQTGGWIVGGDAQGNPTGGDFQLCWIPEFLAGVGIELTPELKAYQQRIHDRPAWQRALQKGGPFDMAKF